MIAGFISLLLLAIFLISSVFPRGGLDGKLQPIVKDHLFGAVQWELTKLPPALVPHFGRGPDTGPTGSQRVIDYFRLLQQERSLRQQIEVVRSGTGLGDLASLESQLAALEKQVKAQTGTVQQIMERQVRDTLAAQGIYNPWIPMHVSFPPIKFVLERPPSLLVVSPRDRIEPLREITLDPHLSTTDRDEIEARVEALGYSALVTEIGGIGATFPTFVNNDMGLRDTIDTAAEEWLHQYLAFKPLGFLYVLDITGLRRNYDIATMNEGLADMASEEIGGLVFEKYYAPLLGPPPPPPSPEKPEFDFNAVMRQIRLTVDQLLAEGQVDRAEQYMKEQQQFLATKGYYIRKLNQAYFAFHGTYAGTPASSSPIGDQLETLRSRLPTLGKFVNRVAGMTSARALAKAAK